MWLSLCPCVLVVVHSEVAIIRVGPPLEENASVRFLLKPNVYVTPFSTLLNL